MARRDTFVTNLLLTFLWIVIGLTRAVVIIDQPARWVDIVMIMVCSLVAGVFFSRAIIARRLRLAQNAGSTTPK